MPIVIVTIYTFYFVLSYIVVIYNFFLLIWITCTYLQKCYLLGHLKTVVGLYQFLIPFFSLGTFYTDFNFIAVEFQYITC